jgi:ribonucleoside-diphosphate reductase alpha chain
MWLKLRDDVMRYGIYNRNLQAIPPTGSISYINHATSSIHPIVSKIEIRKEGKTGRVYYPAPFMTNDNLALYQDAWEIGPQKIIDTYAEATRHVDQGLSLTLFFPDTATTRDINKAQIYAWKKGHQNAVLHPSAPAGAGRYRNRRLRVLRAVRRTG